MADFRTITQFDAYISGYTMLCDYSQPLIPRTYFSNIVTPSIILGTGLPPYTYEWRWSESGILSSSNPGTYLGNASSVTINSILSCPEFFLHLRVTSSDGIVITDTYYIESGACYDCYYGGKTGVTNNNFQVRYIADTQQLDLQIPTIASGNNSLFHLFDIHGRVVTRSVIDKTDMHQTINTYNLQRGMYICSLQTGNQVLTQKIMIIN